MANRVIPEIDWSKLDAMLMFDASLSVVASELEISHDTVERHIKKKFNMSFGEYKQTQLDRTVLRLKQKMIKKALDGDNCCLIFTLKNLSTWSDKVEHSFDKDKKTILLKYNLEDAETVVKSAEIKDVAEYKKDT